MHSIETGWPRTEGTPSLPQARSPRRPPGGATAQPLHAATQGHTSPIKNPFPLHILPQRQHLNPLFSSLLPPSHRSHLSLHRGVAPTTGQKRLRPPRGRGDRDVGRPVSETLCSPTLLGGICVTSWVIVVLLLCIQQLCKCSRVGLCTNVIRGQREGGSGSNMWLGLNCVTAKCTAWSRPTVITDKLWIC